MTVDATQKGKNEFEVRRQELAAKRLDSIIESGAKSEDQLGRLALARSYLNQYDTGIFSNFSLFVKQMANSIGLDLSKFDLNGPVGVGEAARALFDRMSLDMIQLTKGPISDKEMVMFRGMMPSLSNSRQGNMLIIDALERQAKRNIEISSLAQDYVENSGKWLDGFDKVIKKYYADNPEILQVMEVGPGKWAYSVHGPVDQAHPGGIYVYDYVTGQGFTGHRQARR